MERADALVTIKEVAAEVLSVDPDLVTESARFKEDLDADSLDLVELVMGLEVRDFDPTEYLGAKEARRIDRVTQLGFAASADALADTGDHRCDPARSAVIVGTGVGGLITLEEQIGVYNDKGAARVSPFLVPM